MAARHMTVGPLPGQPGNGGRPPGAANVRNRKVIGGYLRDGEPLPIDVMMTNMRFYHQEAADLTERLRDWMDQARDMEELSVEALKELVELYERVGNARDRAQSAAVQAAPYMHPRLNALAVVPRKPEDAKKVTKFTMTIGTGATDGGEDNSIELEGTATEELADTGK